MNDVVAANAEVERLTDWVRHLTEHHAAKIAEYTDTCDKVMDSLVATQRRERATVDALSADVLVLRAALQSLYDATALMAQDEPGFVTPAWYDNFDVARAAAGVVLGGDNE